MAQYAHVNSSSSGQEAPSLYTTCSLFPFAVTSDAAWILGARGEYHNDRP